MRGKGVRMKTVKIGLDKEQYSVLEKWLEYPNSSKLASNQPIKEEDFFGDILYSIYSSVDDGWSTREILLEEAKEDIEFLRLLTAKVYPEEPDFFFRQLGDEEIICKHNCDILIELQL